MFTILYNNVVCILFFCLLVLTIVIGFNLVATETVQPTETITVNRSAIFCLVFLRFSPIHLGFSLMGALLVASNLLPRDTLNKDWNSYRPHCAFFSQFTEFITKRSKAYIFSHDSRNFVNRHFAFDFVDVGKKWCLVP